MSEHLGDTLETAFLHALERTRRYQLFGRILELMDDAWGLLMRLEEDR
jgi:hypothetical protein